MRWNHWIAMVPMVLLVTLTARPIETFLTNATDRFLFQKKYDYQELLKTFASEILTVLDLKKLCDQTVEALIRIVKLESAAMLLYDRNARTCTIAAERGIGDTKIVLRDQDFLVSFLKETNRPFLNDTVIEEPAKGANELIRNFQRMNFELYLPMELNGEFLGILCLGAKKSGENYTHQEIDLLYALARTEAIAISNATLFNELAKTQAEAAQKEKMAVIGTLAAGINHEINNPLGIARGMCEVFLLEEKEGRFEGKTPVEMKERFVAVARKVIFEVDKAASITRKLANFAKPSKGLDFERVSIVAEIEEVLSLIEHDLRKHNIDIQRDFPESFPVIMGDKKQIQEVLFNLIRNGVQAMEKAGSGTMLLSGHDENGEVVLRIGDNGPGIPPEQVEQIFNPFFTTKDPGKGTGLGLFIVRRLIERHKGTIQVDSKVGEGTTFTIRFPIHHDLNAAS